ncbi:MAG TPA: YCF48-related protein [Ignavibacteria bacterium]
MKPSKYISNFLDVLIAFVLLLFFASFGFRDGRTSGWYQQFFPNLNGSTITSITFLDSLTGFAVTNSNSLLQEYILKTTNGGDNWLINFTFNTQNSNWSFVKIASVDSNTVFAFSWTEMFTTTNRGNNWNLINYDLYPDDIAVINKDTILAVLSNGFDGGVYRTTNGGLNWQALGPVGGSGQPYSIYMFNKDIGFNQGSSGMKKTTNGGVNWFVIPGEMYSGIKFIDSLTGWKCTDSIKKTINGGLNWISQRAPNFSNSFTNSSFSIINQDTIWLVGARKFSHAPIYKTTNGGTNWGYQVPDTTFQIYSYNFISFINSKVGWVSLMQNNYEIHTITGGNDTTFFTGIKLVENFIPSGYTLGQNYPNPFNPSTNIPFELNESGYIILKVYDITGRTIKEMINGRWGKGRYILDFDGSRLPSGIYFYRIEITGDITKTPFTETKKMLMIK